MTAQRTTPGLGLAATSGRSRELLSIQYLRAVAAIAVLIFHAAQRAGAEFGPGAAGVDVFFVISGFIMWVISAQRPTTPFIFLARRAARIVPLYWLVTLGVAGIAIAVPAAFPHMQPTFGHIAKSLLFYPHRDETGAIAPLIVPGWTLNYEVFFYLVFAISLALAGGRRIVALTAMLVALVLAGQWWHPAAPALSTYSDPLLLEFLAGVWLGKAWSDGVRLPRPWGIAAIILGFSIFAAVAVAGFDVTPVRIVVWGLPAFLIVAGAIALEPVRDWPALKFLGDASYSIYLVHGLALAFCARLLGMLHIDAFGIVLVVSVIGGIAVGCGCYWLIERPLLRLFHPRRRKANPTATHNAIISPALVEALVIHPNDAI